MRGVVIAVVVGLVGGCLPAPPDPVYAVRRSALVSHPAPPSRSGAPMTRDVEFQLSHSTVVVPIEPVETIGANAGLYVARHNIGGGVRFRTTENFDLGLRFETSLLRGAMAIAKDRDAPPYGTSVAFGPTFHYAAPLGGGFYLGFAMDLLLRWNPYREEGRCIRNCSYGADSYVESGNHVHLQPTFAVLPSYRAGRFTVFVGLTRRNHATNTKNDTQTESANERDDADELRTGPAYVLLGGGVEAELGSGFKLLAHVYQPVSTSVARYGPVLGLALSFGFDRLPLPQAPQRQWRRPQ